MTDWAARAERWGGIRSDTVTVKGHEAAVLVAEEHAEGTPQLLIHGLGGSSWNWVEVVRGLAVHGPVVAVDLPGFGATTVPRGGSARVPANAAFVAAMVRAMGWDRVTLYGNSMGGVIATLVAAANRDLVDRLVLVDPALPAPRSQQLRPQGRSQARVALAGLPYIGSLAVRAGFRYRSAERMVDDTIAGVYADPMAVLPEIRELFLERIAEARTMPWRLTALSQAAESLIALIVASRPLFRAVEAITAPTLLIWGDQDRLITRAVIDGLLKRRPDWDLEVVPSSGHAPMLESPDAFLDAVARWFAGAPTADREAVAV